MDQTDYTDYTFTTTSTSLDDGTAAAFLGAWAIMWLISMAVSVLLVVSLWKLFTKAGKPGWAAIVPVYNIIIMMEIIGRPTWWTVLYFVPFANIVISIINMIDFAKSFGKSAGYGVLMIFFPYIMYPILAFSTDTKYVGPVALEATPAQ